MSHRERGTSYVSLYWTIGFGLLTIAAIAVAFFQSSEVGKQRKEIADLEGRVAEKQSMVDDAAKRYRDFSAKAGFTGDKADGSPELAQKAVDAAKAVLGTDTPANAATTEACLGALIEVVNRRAREVAERDQQIAQLKSESSSQTAALQQARADLQRQIDEAAARARDDKASDQAQIQNLQQQVQDKERAAKESADKVTALQEQKDREANDWTKKASLLEAKNADLNTKLAFTRQPDVPKGSIIATSDLLPIGYIDIGDEGRAMVGMRFEAVNYDSKHKLAPKGFVVITRVEPKISEVRFEASDKLNPIVKGDLLLNPLYNPKSDRVAVLAGRFPLVVGGRKGIEQKLKDLGVTVREKVDASTDYLIVGNPDLSNTGDPMDMEANPEVMAAARFGTMRYTLKELEGYFRK